MAQRDMVRALPNERFDLGDFEALQRNVRSDLRSQLAALLFGASTTVADLKRVISYWNIEASAPADALVTITRGTATGAEDLPDSTQEYGVLFGREAQTTQTLDFTGQPNDTYDIYVRYSATPGVPGTRVFWNATAAAEVVSAMDTRHVVDWDVVFATSSPGNEYVKIGEVVWGGSTVSSGNITLTQVSLFEGDSDNAYAHVWGDGGSDRDTNRLVNGVQDLTTWIGAMRRQIEELMDATLATKWYETPPYTLDDALTHAADASDPHGATLTQTNLVVSTLATLADVEIADLLDADAMVLWNDTSKTDAMACRELVTPQDIVNNFDTLGQFGAGTVAPFLDETFQGDSVIYAAFTPLTMSAAAHVCLIPLRLEGAHPLGSATAEISAILVNYGITAAGSDRPLLDMAILRVNQGTGAMGEYTVLADVSIVEASDTASRGIAATFNSGADGFPLTLDTRTYNYVLRLTFDGATNSPNTSNIIALFNIEIQFTKPALHNTRT